MIVLDVGGTKIAVAAGDGGRLGPVRRVPTPSTAPLEALTALIDDVSGGAPTDAIALSVPGPFERAAGRLLEPPGLPAAWHGLPLRDRLHARYRCRVVVENDANCAALAEASWGAGRDARTVVYFTVSTGVGTGVVRDRALVVSRHDTEGGHQVVWPDWLGGPRCHCGGSGCLEALVGGLAIERRFGVRAEHLTEAAAWEDVGRWLGLAVVNATALLDPDAVIFGGGVCASWERFAPAMLSTVQSHLFLQPAPRIALGTLGEERNLLGALALIVAA